MFEVSYLYRIAIAVLPGKQTGISTSPFHNVSLRITSKTTLNHIMVLACAELRKLNSVYFTLDSFWQITLIVFMCNLDVCIVYKITKVRSELRVCVELCVSGCFMVKANVSLTGRTVRTYSGFCTRENLSYKHQSNHTIQIKLVLAVDAFSSV